MSSLEDRMSALENRVGVVEGLRAMTDSDLGTVAAQRSSARATW